MLPEDSSQNEESTAEEIIESDEELTKETDEESIHHSSVSSGESDVEYLKSTSTKETNNWRVSQILDISHSQILKAFGTFKASKSFNNVKSINLQRPSTKEASKASLITDSDPNTNIKI